MLKNYLTTALRGLLKYRLYSLVNIFGLAIGFAASLILFQYIINQYSFDGFHEKKQDTFRLAQDVVLENSVLNKFSAINYELTQKIKAELPEVKEIVTMDRIDYANTTFTYEAGETPLSFNETGVFFASRSLFEVFDFQIKEGGIENFTGPDKIILTSSTAAKYFGQNNAIGEILTLSSNLGTHKYEVVGIVEDLPPNTHFNFNVLISMEALKNYSDDINSNGVFTYALLEPPYDIEKVADKMSKMHLERYGKAEDGTFRDYSLQPLEAIYLSFSDYTGFRKYGNKRALDIMSIVAIVILVIAWFNFINLASVRALQKAKEVGIRKVFGSDKKNILYQFLIESVFINLLALFISIILIQLSSRALQEWLDFQVFLDFSPLQLLGIILVFISGIAISSFYPALILTSFNPITVLSGRAGFLKGGHSIRKGLVTFQFVLSLILIAATVAVYKQVNFMQNAELGMAIDDVIVIKSPPGSLIDEKKDFVVKVKEFKDRLDKEPLIKGMSTSSSIPGESITWGGTVRQKSQNEDKDLATGYIAMDEDFQQLFDLELLAGRYNNENDDPWNGGEVVINEQLALDLGYSDPKNAVGARLTSSQTRNDLIVKGVVGNHHYRSLKEDFPRIIYMSSIWTNYYSVRFNIDSDLSAVEKGEQLKAGVNRIEKLWKEFFPNATLDFFFLEDSFNRQYQNEMQFGKIFTLFSALAIIIASLGLFGLTSFAIAQKTKDIGIRKILGAEIPELVFYLSREYTLMILISIVIASPVVWYLVSRWLENFAFKTDMGVWIFAIPLLLLVIISAIAIGGTVYKAASRNPVLALRDE